MPKGLKVLSVFCVAGLAAYFSLCLYLFSKQRSVIFNPKPYVVKTPSDPPVELDYDSVEILVGHSNEKLNGWWLPRRDPLKTPEWPQEPSNIASSVKVILYLGGRSSNRSFHLERIEGLHQLGFDILTIDYRGYGDSEQREPSEASVYQDSQAAWDYLTKTRNIPPEEILIYGESLGGAIAINLAVNQPDVGGVVLQSTFTSMEDMVDKILGARFFPLDWLLTERFDSIEKIGSLRTPVLFLHGHEDAVVPYQMSQRLFQQAPEPKKLVVIPNANHYSIYRPGRYSHLSAIAEFVTRIVPTKKLSGALDEG